MRPDLVLLRSDSDLAAKAELRGWRAQACPAEIGCRGLMATSAVRLMKDLGISAQFLRQAIREAIQGDRAK